MILFSFPIYNVALDIDAIEKNLFILTKAVLYYGILFLNTEKLVVFEEKHSLLNNTHAGQDKVRNIVRIKT